MRYNRSSQYREARNLRQRRSIIRLLFLIIFLGLVAAVLWFREPITDFFSNQREGVLNATVEAAIDLTETATRQPSPTASSTSTATATVTPTATNTPTATSTATSTVTRTPTSTQTPSDTPTPTKTSTNTPTPTATVPVLEQTATARFGLVDGSPVASETPGTATLRPSFQTATAWALQPTRTPRDTDTPIPTFTVTSSPTVTETVTVSPTTTPTLTLTQTPSPTVTASRTPTATDTPTAAETSTLRPSFQTATAWALEPTDTTKPTLTSTASITPTRTPAPTETAARISASPTGLPDNCRRFVPEGIYVWEVVGQQLVAAYREAGVTADVLIRTVGDYCETSEGISFLPGVRSEFDIRFNEMDLEDTEALAALLDPTVAVVLRLGADLPNPRGVRIAFADDSDAITTDSFFPDLRNLYRERELRGMDLYEALIKP